MNNAYKQLVEIFKNIKQLNNIVAILRWDSAVIMPRGSVDARSEQVACLTNAIHEALANEKVAELIHQVQVEDLTDWDQANYKLMKKTYKNNTSISADLARALVMATSKSEMIWRTAKNENNYKLFAPYLKEVLNLTKQAASFRAQAFNLPVYDSLLDSYEPEFSTKEIDVIFTDLRNFLPEFIGKVVEHQKTKYGYHDQDHNVSLPIDLQKEIGMECMRLMGFDFNKGRLDISEHPFCGGISQDLRITTRYKENNFISGLMGIIHETGHALYEQNLPSKWIDQPVGQHLGMATHESQSLIWEYRVGRSKEFLEFLSKLLRDKFNLKSEQFSSENLYKSVNKVYPSFIRVDADEVTYSAHVIMRYDLEKSLMSGDLDVDDLPQAWNEAMVKMLDIKPPSDREGCLQDIHWPCGAFGYFPFYAIGAITASQLYQAFSKNNQNNNIVEGKFDNFREWLNLNVHNHGSKFNLQELLKNSTGENLSIEPYKNYLNNKFLGS